MAILNRPFLKQPPKPDLTNLRYNTPPPMTQPNLSQFIEDFNNPNVKITGSNSPFTKGFNDPNVMIGEQSTLDDRKSQLFENLNTWRQNNPQSEKKSLTPPNYQYNPPNYQYNPQIGTTPPLRTPSFLPKKTTSVDDIPKWKQHIEQITSQISDKSSLLSKAQSAGLGQEQQIPPVVTPIPDWVKRAENLYKNNPQII
jgi:hypothetical protein